MQTSKSYGQNQTSNVQIKLELDDLEYIFADGQNLVIKPNVSNNEDSEDSNIIYTDGSQAVVLPNGAKHFIQTVDGETYLFGSDSENIQQLVINEDPLEESSDAVEYIEDDEVKAETIVYKLTDDKDDIEEVEPQPKRFRIGDVEYVTIDESETLQIDDDSQFSVIDEENIPESEAIQYAILKNGKLHLQLGESDSVQVIDETADEQAETPANTEDTEVTEKHEQYIFDKEKIQEFVLINTADIPSENSIDLTKIPGKDLLTGKTVTLDEYLDTQRKVHKLESPNLSIYDNVKSNSNIKTSDFLNKKVLIRKNPNGKSLFGKILHIEHPKKPIENPGTKVEIHDHENNETIVLNVETEIINPNQTSDNNENARQELTCEKSEEMDDEQNQLDTEKEATEEQMNFLSKTLNGLSDMPSLRKKLMEQRLEIKYIEKQYDSETGGYVKDVRFINGCLMHQNSGELVVNGNEEQTNVTSLTVIVTNDENNEKTTKVTFHEKQFTCPTCQRNFHTLVLLNRHMQIYHTDRSLSCNICQVKFSNQILLTEHRKANGHYYHCEICNRRLTTQSSLRRHQSVHDPNLKHLECVICQARFSHVSSLSKHVLTHTLFKAYQCECCGKAFTTLSDLNAHRKHHYNVKMYYCEICGREFSRHSNLLRHIEIHKGNGDLYKCGTCDCSYKFISSLTRHIVQNHIKGT